MDTPDASTPDESKLGDPGKAALAAERKARRDAEKQLREVNAQLTALTDRDKTELQRATERAEQAEQQATEATKRWNRAAKHAAITTAATAANAIDTDAVAALISTHVTITDEGTITGVDEAISHLQQTKPRLFGRPPHTPAGMRDATARATPPALNSSGLEDALRAALSGQPTTL